MKTITDGHTSHCCKVHGCKYGKEDCTVTTEKAPQEYPCEMCYDLAYRPTERLKEYIKSRINKYSGGKGIYSSGLLDAYNQVLIELEQYEKENESGDDWW